jgi:hypothetical protein
MPSRSENSSRTRSASARSDAGSCSIGKHDAASTRAGDAVAGVGDVLEPIRVDEVVHAALRRPSAIVAAGRTMRRGSDMMVAKEDPYAR